MLSNCISRECRIQSNRVLCKRQLSEMSDPIVKEIVSYLERSTTIRVNGCEPAKCSLDSLDSLEMFGFITFMENSFGIAVRDRDVRPENFETVAAAARFICKKRGEVN